MTAVAAVVPLMVSMPGTQRSVPVARHWIAQVVEAYGGSGIDDALLVASELVGNAVRHSRSGEPGGRVVVLIARRGQAGVRIEVIDEGAETIPRQRDPDWERESGRGLWLVQQMSLAWGGGGTDGRTAGGMGRGGGALPHAG
ncbi:ATP-binding protein [Spongiactinospora sp. TRM90649]|uniref:ATP-binding protein n=1 Tax=Spongiactinospora sp. TRM90649 TaxID=3031114 RepID=UPI0023F6452D|nr:ATP-binding protein [Spongiactinospora sp. TRM90649]MDF5751281.1 ATP-binding protein [Spongiactinospora sp. TRM90649]